MGVEQALYNGRVKTSGGGGRLVVVPCRRGLEIMVLGFGLSSGGCRGHATWSRVAGLGSKCRLIRLSSEVQSNPMLREGFFLLSNGLCIKKY